uniref:CHASE domain-containing protein n=2 Tax=Xanthomonas TaxID=338 RepID=UPI001F1A5C70
MSNQRRTPVAGPARLARLAALAVLAVGLLAALLIAHGVQQRNRAQAQARFDQLASHVASDLRQRLDMYEHGLRGARGAVIAAGGEHISRERFARYSASRDYLREFPGVRGFGYIQRVPRADEAAFLQQAHADGAPSLRIVELAPHDGDRFVIVYIQPLRSNNAAEGFDIASEPARRAAAIAAA